MVFDSKPSSVFSHTFMVRCCVLLVLISTKFTNCNIISITRLPNQDDSFDVVSQQGLLCPTKVCSKYNADQKLSGISDSCLCQCTSPLSTFYTKTHTCMKSKDVVDQNKCNIRIKDYKRESLPVIDILSTPGSLRLENTMHGTSCSNIKTSWFYLKNGTWYMGKNGMLSVTIKQHWTKPDMWFLKWYSGLHSNYSGIIIKVVVTCEHDSILDDNDEGCLMFKTQGTFYVNQTNIIPTKRPHISTTATPETSQPTIKTESSTEYKPTQATTSTTKKQAKSTTPPTQSTTVIPDKEPRKDTSTGDKKIWIAFAAGGITIFFVMVGSLIFFILLCRQRKKQISRAEGQSSTRTENGNDPLHDYEYVVYPVLTEGYHESSSSRSLDNAMYGRGPDNELIIRTPGISMESLATNSINHNREGYHGKKRSSSAYYPRDITPLNHIVNMSNTIGGNSSHEYAQLQRKQEDATDSSGIYQPLIRPVTPEINDNRPDKNQAISLEPITTSATPDYMVLEPNDSCEQDLSA